nr:MAG TPA: hypothetical protein [Caudoviricetes sp.]
MANFHVQGIDGLAKGLELLGQKTGPMAEDMLHAGALILIGTWNRVIIARGHVETGAMLRSVKATKPKINKDGNLEIQVYPQGAERKEHRKKPVRNAEKAFVLHYGWKSKKGDHFVDEIEESGTPKAIDAMEYIMSKEIERSGL